MPSCVRYVSTGAVIKHSLRELNTCWYSGVQLKSLFFWAFLWWFIFSESVAVPSTDTCPRKFPFSLYWSIPQSSEHFIQVKVTFIKVFRITIISSSYQAIFPWQTTESNSIRHSFVAGSLDNPDIITLNWLRALPVIEFDLHHRIWFGVAKKLLSSFGNSNPFNTSFFWKMFPGIQKLFTEFSGYHLFVAAAYIILHLNYSYNCLAFFGDHPVFINIYFLYWNDFWVLIKASRCCLGIGFTSYLECLSF